MQEDLKRAVADWKDGKAVRVLVLGHGKDFRQQFAYECVFRVLDEFLKDNAAIPETHTVVEVLVLELAKDLNLSDEEQSAAISLAWLALRNGWATALAGFPEHKYQMLTREATAA